MFLFSLASASEAKKPYYKILFTPFMKILDVNNEKVIEGNRRRIRKLMKREEFRTALLRDGKISPTRFQHFLNEHPKVGKKISISKKMFNIIKKEAKKPLTCFTRKGCKGQSCKVLLASVLYGGTKTVKALVLHQHLKDKKDIYAKVVKAIDNANKISSSPINYLQCEGETTEQTISKLLNKKV